MATTANSTTDTEEKVTDGTATGSSGTTTGTSGTTTGTSGTTTGTSGTTTGTSGTSTTTSSSTTTTSIPNYADEERASMINQMYDANIASQKASLQSSYEQSLSDYEANRDKISKEYQVQKNSNTADYERAKRNFNEQASLSGINTGVGSQARLAQDNAYLKSQATLGASEATDLASNEKSIADLKVSYQNSINEAVATNDYNRAAALLDEYQQSYQNALTNAQTLASYGDFSGYVTLYGQEQADNMAQAWALQNPLLAYNMGKISASQYFGVTGSYPPGYSTGGGSSSSSSSGGTKSTTTNYLSEALSLIGVDGSNNNTTTADDYINSITDLSALEKAALKKTVDDDAKNSQKAINRIKNITSGKSLI